MESFVLFFVITCVGAAFAVPKTNVVKTIEVGDVTISCSDAGGWRFSTFPTKILDGREVVTVRLDSSAGGSVAKEGLQRIGVPRGGFLRLQFNSSHKERKDK